MSKTIKVRVASQIEGRRRGSHVWGLTQKTEDVSEEEYRKLCKDPVLSVVLVGDLPPPAIDVQVLIAERDEAKALHAAATAKIAALEAKLTKVPSEAEIIDLLQKNASVLADLGRAKQELDALKAEVETLKAIKPDAAPEISTKKKS